MKIEWWCETHQGFTTLVAQVNQGPLFKSPISWNCSKNAHGAKTFLTLVHLYVMEQIELLYSPFPACQKGEVTELEWDIYYPQGLFYLDKKPPEKRWPIICDGIQDKQLKFKPPVGKGPRGRWG